MSNIIITSPGKPQALIVRATLNVHTGKKIAEAFTKEWEKDYPLHDLLRMNFGEDQYRWYCIDMSNDVYEVTFSNMPNPRVLQYQSVAARIATSDAELFTLKLQVADIIKPGRLTPSRESPSFIS